MKNIIVFLSFVLKCLSTSHDSRTEEKWIHFLNINNKTYATWESRKRFQIFSRNMKKIEEHNKRFSRGLETFEMGLGPFTDQTEEEFIARFKELPAPVEKIDIPYFTLNQSGHSVPYRVDYRHVMQPAKDQKDCRSSWAFATVASIEGMAKLRLKKDISLSEQHLVNCAYGNEFKSYGCNTGTIWGALYYMRTRGIDTTENQPYSGVQSRCRGAPASAVRLKSTFQVVANEYELRDVVGTVGPVTTTVMVSPTIMHYKSGVVFDRKCAVKGVNHAVAIVGYGTEDGFEYWLVRNSWGVTWGDHGYYKIARNYRHNCQIGETVFFAELDS